MELGPEDELLVATLKEEFPEPNIKIWVEEEPGKFGFTTTFNSEITSYILSNLLSHILEQKLVKH